MKNIVLTEKQIALVTKSLITESGIQDIKKLAERYPKAQIYFHLDLDGVVSAIAMREYLQRYGIDVVGYKTIQYGDKEFALVKPDASEDVMPVLVDFAHGKPEFKIHTDHHDSQTGVEDAATQFKSARSNVETISGIISPTDIFPTGDIDLFRTVDSADFHRQGIKPEDVISFIFNLDKEKDIEKNKQAAGFALNKLILAYKNKPGFLEKLATYSNPSIVSMFMKGKQLAKDMGFVGVEELQSNADNYRERLRDFDKVTKEGKILVQYGIPSAFKPGSYDRYASLEMHPDVEYFLMIWPMGLLQTSCNPFKEKFDENVNLGEMASEVLEEHKSELSAIEVPLSQIKRISERSVTATLQKLMKQSDEDFGDVKSEKDFFGFRFKDLVALYNDKIKGINPDKKSSFKDMIVDITNKPFSDLSYKQKQMLDYITVNAYDIIVANSGGHPCITNISGINYLGKDGLPMLKKLAAAMLSKLKQKLKQ
jgi:hypothetical protein|tara:strand:- start:3454 stop:4899 length:1446 start_codon:yes stop_codon:yes gene_type:complete